MRAIVAREWGNADVLKVEEVPDPEPGPGDVLVALKAIGINPVETYIRSGVYAQLPDLPCILGGDGAGVVESVGENVTSIQPGARVYVGGIVGGKMTGCYAEKVVRPADELFVLPDNASFDAGASLGVPYATAHYGLFSRGRAQAGETVLIHGASGAVGTAATQLAKARGLTVIGSAGTEAGLKLVKDQGADHVVDHTQEGYLEKIQEITGEDGPHLILEMLANVNLQNDLDLVSKYGRIVIIGSRGTIDVNPRSAMMKDVDVLGLALWNCPQDDLLQIHEDLIDGLKDGSLTPVIRKQMPLAEAAQAHIDVLVPGAFGKIVLTP